MIAAPGFTGSGGDRRPDGLHTPSAISTKRRTKRVKAALANVRRLCRLLPAMYELLPCRFEIYPTPEGLPSLSDMARPPSIRLRARAFRPDLVRFGQRHALLGHQHERRSSPRTIFRRGPFA